MKKYLSLLAIVSVILAACSNDDDSVITEYGYLNLTIDTDETVVLPVRAATAEELQDYTVILAQSDEIVWEKKYSEIEDTDLSFTRGNGYTVTAENCTETEAETANDNLGQARYAGTSETFKITIGETTDVSVTCSMQNAQVSVTFDESFTEAYTTYSFDFYKTEDADRTFSYTETTTDTSSYVYFNTGDNSELTYALKATKDAEERTLASGTVTLVAAKWIMFSISTSPNGFVAISTVSIDNTVEEEDSTHSISPYS